VITDQKTGGSWVPLNNVSHSQGKLKIYNSSLSEYSVLGFEYGYSLATPKSLVIWEAQFGDFANGAQIMIDQFICSSGIKWHRYSGLVMLLPHGYEGQGPEHSSARLERFLQLCADDNMQVTNCTTPAQYFHLLRRQILRQSRRPLIVMSPKSLLRLPEAGSTLSDIELGVFREVLHDKTVNDPKKVERIVFCSGKIYYDVLKNKKEKNIENVALVRVEQLYPYPAKEIDEVIATYTNAKEIVWLQEEPLNQGAWWYIEDRLREQLKKDQSFRAVARPASASPAAGLMKVHKQEQDELVRQATE
jgi:2-oxoglutarate dehydrogenase E1 component